MQPTQSTTPARQLPWYRRLGIQVLIGLAAGTALGLLAPQAAASMKILGDMFLSLIKAGIAPLIFLTIVSGINSAGDARSAGKVGLRALLYFEVLSTIALALGLLAGNLLNIGAGIHPTATQGSAAPTAAPHEGFVGFLRHLVPDNVVGAFVHGDTLQVVVMSALFGIGLLALPTDRRERIAAGLDTLSQLVFSFINLVMKLAPIGAFGAIAFVVGSNGTAVLISLAQFVVSFYGVVLVFVVVVLGITCRLAKISLWGLLRYIKEEIFIVLGTASSESALPGLLRKLENLGCSAQAVGLVLPTGYAFNLDGTSIFMSMGVMFLANAYGVDLSLTQQLGIMLVMMLTSKGAATVSGGSFVVFAATVTSMHVLPVDGLAIIFGVYRFLSIAVSTCNTIGNSVATVVVAKWSNEFDAERANAILRAGSVPAQAAGTPASTAPASLTKSFEAK
ncbi:MULTISPECIES: cation:dicarboxylate symporter family transporter [unclassified Achromobacter]|uniref:cation:dicarboxylate symporter family transporter n=1 Tax=unclassified Achromobacter TaxID=2626865 RepID=UPI000B51BDC0|nr:MULTISPECIES: cation:dicarboxylase symporter family transporter [unclassified Achromobacter]OWT71414.1 dicarboxylate/amino acid:cation symporter [Achromobacter sp. HZ34]OWT73071.1 dicarboxylate/amino acid:cation symporter [Achromobacter sp. HZ28]